MAPRARRNEHKPFLVDAVYEKPVRLNMTLAVSAIRAAKRVVAYCLRQDFLAYQRLKSSLELRKILTRSLDALVILLEFGSESQPSMAYSSSRAAIASLTVR